MGLKLCENWRHGSGTVGEATAYQLADLGIEHLSMYHLKSPHSSNR